MYFSSATNLTERDICSLLLTSVHSSHITEYSSFSFTFSAIFLTIKDLQIAMISFCVQGLVYCAFFWPCSKCCRRSGSPKALNSSIALKFPLLVALCELQLASRCPLNEIFCLPHKMIQSIIVSSHLELRWCNCWRLLLRVVLIVGWLPDWASLKLTWIANAHLMCVGHVEWAFTLLLKVVQLETGLWTKFSASPASPNKEHGRHKHASRFTEYPSHL